MNHPLVNQIKKSLEKNDIVSCHRVKHDYSTAYHFRFKKKNRNIPDVWHIACVEFGEEWAGIYVYNSMDLFNLFDIEEDEENRLFDPLSDADAALIATLLETYSNKVTEP